MTYVGKKVEPQELRASFVEAWSAQDQRWAEERERCHCRKPVRGATYLRVTRCARCGGTIFIAKLGELRSDAKPA